MSGFLRWIVDFGAVIFMHGSQVDPALHGTGHDPVTEQQS